MLPHVGLQPLAYLYLSQIPYTGLDLGPLGTMLYWIALIGWALALAYLVLFGAMPLASRSIRTFGTRVTETLNMRELTYAGTIVAPVTLPEPAPLPPPALPEQAPREAMRGYSSYDGFKSFAHNGALSIEDIVKGLARSHPASAHVEPVYEKVEPIYEHVEPITADTSAEAVSVSAPAHIRGFISALVEGDRMAVFAGLRQQVRGSGSPEKLIAEIVFLLDDAYRARIDGTACDADIARLSARLNTPTLEKIIAALTTAIDSSYSTGVTGVKLALTRALSILGA
ncbi:MAG: hypothetical protein Q7R59_02865 [bacterium]|nr:hypothetical protein [bacterium]